MSTLSLAKAANDELINSQYLFLIIFFVCEVGAVGKVSDCQPEGSGFNPRPGQGLNFGQPSFATPSMDRDVKLLVVSRRSTVGLKRTHTLIDKSRLMPVLWSVTSSSL